MCPLKAKFPILCWSNFCPCWTAVGCYVLLYVVCNSVICVVDYGAHTERINVFPLKGANEFQEACPHQRLDKGRYNICCPHSICNKYKFHGYITALPGNKKEKWTLDHWGLPIDTCTDSLCKLNYHIIFISTPTNTISKNGQKGLTTVEWTWCRHQNAITRTQGAPKILCTGPANCVCFNHKAYKFLKPCDHLSASSHLKWW